MNWIFALVIVAIMAKLMVQLWLSQLNRTYAKAQKDKLPENLIGVVTPEAHAKSADYTLEHSFLGSTERLWGAVVKISILVFGIIPMVYNFTIAHWGVENFWALSLMITLFGMAVSILFWPFEWLSTFGIEAKYGFNRETPALWISDQLKSWALTLLLAVPITALLLWMAQTNFINWWLYAFAAMLIFEILLNFIYPNFIEPLFNKFTPLPQGPLRTRLEELCLKSNISVKKILVMDASRRSAHANAYFAGMGSARRIVLYDTLLQQLSDEEIAAVLAHEIGHMKHKHVLRGIYVGSACQLLGFCVVALLVQWELFYNAFGLTQAGGVAGAFFILSVIGGVFSFWFIPAMSQWYRAHEYQADAYAARLIGSGAPLITGLKKMTKESLASIEDHPTSHAFYASHPTLKERESALNKLVLS